MKKDFCVIAYASGEPYTTEAKQLENLCIESNLQFKLYDSEWLKTTQFYLDNKELLNSKKSGYCAWKPFIILDALKTYKKVLYLDSSMLFVKEHIQEFIDTQFSILSTETPLVNRYHTKKETFVIMECDEEKYWNCNQVWAGVILATKDAKGLLNEWLHYCCIKECVSDDYDKTINRDLKYVLYDQSIYSILYKKYHKEQFNNLKIGLVGKDDYFYFVDTREPGHRKSIIEIFGKSYMQKQDNLISDYYNDYYTAGSVVYDPKPFLQDKIMVCTVTVDGEDIEKSIIDFIKNMIDSS